MSKKTTTEHTVSIQLCRNSLGKNSLGLCAPAEEKEKLILYEAAIAGDLKVSGNITNTAINENVFGLTVKLTEDEKKMVCLQE